MATKQEGQQVLEGQAAMLQKQKETAELQKASAEAQKAAADAEKAAIDAQRAALEAAFPKGQAEPVSGEITADADKFGYAAELVAYMSMKESAEAVGKAIDKLSLSPAPAKILVVGERSFAQGDLPLVQLNQQFELFRRMLEAQIGKNEALLEKVRPMEEPLFPEMEGLPPEISPEAELEVLPLGAITAGMTVIPAIASSVADIAGYFRANYTISGQEFELGSEALSAMVAGQIEKHRVHLLNFHLVDDSDLLKRLADLVTKKQELENSKALLESQVVKPITAETDALKASITTQEAELAKLSGDEEAGKIQALKDKIGENKGHLEARQKALEGANKAVAESGNVGKAFGDFVTSVTSAPDDKAQPLLVQAALRDQIRKQGITHLLHLSVLSSGGEAITKKRLWGSGQTAYIGGSAVSYVLATSGGRVVSADTKVALAQLDYNLSAAGAATLKNVRLITKGG
jgi:hypothetical protein